MKKLFLMGRSEAGKTSLTQILSGEELHYHKTQYTNTGTDIIDSPGEYSETKRCGLGLACFSFEADVLALLMAADEPFSVFEANPVRLTLEQAKARQRLGLTEWEDASRFGLA